MKSYNVCIVGGGSTYTLGFLKSFVRLREEFPLKKLVLFDIDAERQEPIRKVLVRFCSESVSLELSTSPETTDIEGSIRGNGFRIHADESWRSSDACKR